MSNDWKEVKLGDLAEIASSKRIYAKEYVESGIPFYRSKEIIEKNSGNDVSTELYISKERFNELKNKFGAPIHGDILLTSVGTLGIPYIVRNEEFYFKDGNLTWLKKFKDNCYNKFIYYWLLSDYGKNQINSRCIGSTQKALTIDTLKKFDIKLPPIEEQKAIAHILSTLDEKIEVNNRINKKLEEMAQTIFKHWFVDFEFPNENREPYKSSGEEMVESELGMIPKGWEVDNIGNLVKEIVTGKTPSTKAPDNYGNKYPFITIPDMHNNVFIIKTERYLSEKGNKVQINKLLPANSINVSCIATVGLVAINAKPAHTNQQINSIIPNRDEDVYYFYEYLKLMSDKLKAIGSTGSTTLNVNKGEFEKMKYIYPQRQVMIRFNNLIKSNFEMIKKKQLENEKLKELKDTLLPKLMSGEIRVPIDN